MTDAEAAAAIQSRLEPGEMLLWSQAAPTEELASERIFFACFATLWCALVVYAAWRLWRARREAAGLIQERTGSGLIVACIMLVVGLFLFTFAWTALLSSWSTSYGLTNWRVIVAFDFPIPNTTSYGRAAFDRAEAAPDGGRGAILFDYGDAGKGGDNYRERLRNVEAPEALLARIRAALAAEPQPAP